MSDKAVGTNGVELVRDFVNEKLGNISPQNDAVVAAINSIDDKPLNGAGLAVLRDWINAKIAAIPIGPDLDESTADATAVAGDILDGKTAYARGAKITGTLPEAVSLGVYQSGNITTSPTAREDESGTWVTENYTKVGGVADTTRVVRENSTYVSVQTKSSLFGDASPSDVLAGKTYTAKDGKTTGTIASKGASDLTASGATVTVPAGYFSTHVSKSVATATQATPGISVSATGLITASATQTEGYVSAGTKSATQQLTTKGADTITPGPSAKTAVAANTYTTGAVNVAGDANLVASNIKSGVSIFGVAGNVVQGVDTSDATAAAGDILSGKTAYVNGTKVTGTIATKTSDNMTASGATITVPPGYYGNYQYKSVSTATQATPSVSITNSTGKVIASATQTAGYVSSGTKSGTLQLTTQAAQTITPGTADKTISSYRWLTGTQTIKGDANLLAGNIKKDISIFGVTGTLDSSTPMFVGDYYSSTSALLIPAHTLLGVPYTDIPNVCSQVLIFVVGTYTTYKDERYGYPTTSNIASFSSTTSSFYGSGCPILVFMDISGTKSSPTSDKFLEVLCIDNSYNNNSTGGSKIQQYIYYQNDTQYDYRNYVYSIDSSGLKIKYNNASSVDSYDTITRFYNTKYGVVFLKNKLLLS